MFAARNNNIEIVRCLLQNNADINKQNLFGETALQIARSNEIILLLNYEREKSKTFLQRLIKDMESLFRTNFENLKFIP